MSKTTSFILGDHLDAFIDGQVKAGKFGNASEVVRAGLRLLEQQERQAALQVAITHGIESGMSSKSIDEIFAEAKRRAKELGLDEN